MTFFGRILLDLTSTEPEISCSRDMLQESQFYANGFLLYTQSQQQNNYNMQRVECYHTSYLFIKSIFREEF